MTAPQPETEYDGEPYPPSWTPWVRRDDPNPLAGLRTATGGEATANPTETTPYPSRWRV
jgi:hypothetical protein